MANDLTFKRLATKPEASVTVWIEGQAVSARMGDSVAAAVLSAGLRPSRTTPVSGSPRAAYCMMGVCFECLMEIDGRANTQACMTVVEEGMQVRFQQGSRQPKEVSA